MKTQYRDAEELKQRTKQFAIDIARLTRSLPENRVNNANCNQMLRLASSTGANCRLHEEPDQKQIISKN